MVWWKRQAKFKSLLHDNPGMTADRADQTFFEQSNPSDAAAEWRRYGMIMLRTALSPQTVSECRNTFQRFVKEVAAKKRQDRTRHPEGAMALDGTVSAEWENGELASGSWHMPWIVRADGQAPTATILAALMQSWAWPVIEKICDSDDIMVMFGLCMARHSIDSDDLTVGVHQDVTAVNSDVPMSIWIPLHDVTPLHNSGLGFVLPAPDHVLPVAPYNELAHNDIGNEYVYQNLQNVWVPTYRAGDLSMHSKFSPHFTTGYKSGAERYSLEIRLWAREDALMQYCDPSVRIRRLNGIPTVLETRCSPGVPAHGFLATAAFLAMQAASARAQHSANGAT